MLNQNPVIDKALREAEARKQKRGLGLFGLLALIKSFRKGQTTMGNMLSSKINWTQIVAMVAWALALFGLDLSAEFQAMIIAAIVPVQSLITFILRTWFNKPA